MPVEKGGDFDQYLAQFCLVFEFFQLFPELGLLI